MCGHSVDCGDEGLAGTWCNLGGQEWKKSILAWFLHGELYVWVLCVDVMEKVLAVFCLLDDKAVINKP